MNDENIERCVSCGRPFEVGEIGGRMPGTRESEEIICPYCSHTITRRSNGAFQTHPLTPDREAEYEKRHPKK